MDMADVEELCTLGDGMNINELTIGQVKEIVAMFGQATGAPAAHPFIGKYAIFVGANWLAFTPVRLFPSMATR